MSFREHRAASEPQERSKTVFWLSREKIADQHTSLGKILNYDVYPCTPYYSVAIRKCF